MALEAPLAFEAKLTPAMILGVTLQASSSILYYAIWIITASALIHMSKEVEVGMLKTGSMALAVSSAVNMITDPASSLFVQLKVAPILWISASAITDVLLIATLTLVYVGLKRAVEALKRTNEQQAV